MHRHPLQGHECAPRGPMQCPNTTSKPQQRRREVPDDDWTPRLLLLVASCSWRGSKGLAARVKGARGQGSLLPLFVSEGTHHDDQARSASRVDAVARASLRRLLGRAYNGGPVTSYQLTSTRQWVADKRDWHVGTRGSKGMHDNATDRLGPPVRVTSPQPGRVGREKEKVGQLWRFWPR
jgi:hypothetical protein